MIKKHTITLALLLGAIATATAQWTTLQLPTPRTLMEGVYAKGKVYFAGGYQQIAPTFIASSVVDIYDIGTGTWSSTNLSQPRINIGGTVLGDSILFVGGTTFDASGNAELSTVMDIYNQTTATWTQATLPVPMRAMSAVTIGTKAYFLKGYSEDFEHDIHVYNGADGTWTTLDISASNRRRLMTAAAVGNKLLCIGGLNESTSQEVDELNVYDTDLGTWTKLTMSSEKQGVRAVTVDNKCYLVGGNDGNNARADLDIYDGTTNTIQTGAFCEFGRVNHAIGAFNGQIIIGGGGTISAQYSPIEVYDIAMDTWVQLYTYSFPGNKNHYLQTGVSTPIGVFFGGGETNFFDVIESRVFILNTVVSTTQPVLGTLQVQPTVAAQQINIRLPESRMDQYEQGEIMLEVLNMQGQVVVTKATLPNSDNWDLSVEGMAAGTYALRMIMGEQVYIGRFVKL